MSVNRIHLIGNLGNAIEIHTFTDGGKIGRVSMATNETYKNKEGEKVTDTQWHSLVFRNKSADLIEQYTKKGDQLYVEGSVKYRSYEQDGQTKYVTEIHVSNFSFLNNQ